jgi:hypothetical protein
MAGERAVESALCAWREAERKLVAATPGTPAYMEACQAYAEARRTYARAAGERLDVDAAVRTLRLDDDPYVRGYPN